MPGARAASLRHHGSLLTGARPCRARRRGRREAAPGRGQPVAAPLSVESLQASLETLIFCNLPGRATAIQRVNLLQYDEQIVCNLPIWVALSAGGRPVGRLRRTGRVWSTRVLRTCCSRVGRAHRGAAGLRQDRDRTPAGRQRGSARRRPECSGSPSGRPGAAVERCDPATARRVAGSLLTFAGKVATDVHRPPSALVVVTGTGYAYRRPDGVDVVPVGHLGP